MVNDFPVQLPTDVWRAEKAEEQRQLAAGEILPAECCMAELFPDEFIEQTHQALSTFMAQIQRCTNGADGFRQVMESIREVVLALNQINQDFDHAVIETGEREDICLFINEYLSSRGISLEALADYNSCKVNELTDEWRDW